MYQILFRWLGLGRARNRNHRQMAGHGRCRLRLELLEDRVVPSTATHFDVSSGLPLLNPVKVPSPQVGDPTAIRVVALDANNLPVNDYSGKITLASTDGATTLVGGAALPATYTFTSIDFGTHYFFVVPGTAGTETITATDQADATITGKLDLTVNPAPAATHFVLFAKSHDFVSGSTVGAATSIEAEAVDDSGRPVENYTGTVKIESTDPATTLDSGNMSLPLPHTYTFTADDHGQHVFELTLGMAGTETITVSDVNTPTISGTVDLTVNAAPTVTHFQVMTAPFFAAGPASANALAPVFVAALDAQNHPVESYTGTVTIASTDPLTALGGGYDPAATLKAATLPQDYTFTSEDHGFHVFVLKPGQAGSEIITVTDKADPTITGKATLDVGAAQVATHFAVVSSPVFEVDDGGGNGLLPPIAIGGGDVPAMMGAVPAPGTGGILPDPLPPVPLPPVPLPPIGVVPPIDLFGQAYVGVPTSVTVIALDASNHIVRGYAGSVKLTSTDTATIIAGTMPYTFTADDHGIHAFTLTPGAAGTETITATDTTDNTIAGSTKLSVIASPVASQIDIKTPPFALVGMPTFVAVAVLDAANQLAANFTGTIQLTSSDMGATSGGMPLPVSYTFTAADHGIHVFQVNFATMGNQTVTVTDAADGFTADATITVGMFKVPPPDGGGDPLQGLLDLGNGLPGGSIGTLPPVTSTPNLPPGGPTPI